MTRTCNNKSTIDTITSILNSTELEDEYWEIKSMYYPELIERYCLTKDGFLKLPHEIKNL